MDLQTELVVISPWYLQRGTRSKKYSMSLNTFLGMDKTMVHLLKSFYKQLIMPQLRGVKLQEPVEVTVQVYTPTKRKSDKSNYYSMGSKFLYDSLVEYGVLSDDNDSVIKTETVLPSKFDKNNGRIEFKFKSINNQLNKKGDEVNNGLCQDEIPFPEIF